MSRKSGKRGRSTVDVEVTNVSRHGFWLLMDGHERYLPFDEFPWFRRATIDQLTNVEVAGARHLRWPDLDVDLAIESIEHPAAYPLISKANLAR